MHDLDVGDCEQLTIVHDRHGGATCAIAVHDTRLGPAHGGIRRWPYAGLADAVRDVVALARAMTWKCALADVPAGGGKAVLIDRPGLDRAAAYRLVGRTVAQLGGRFFTGPDVNTSADDLRAVAAETRFVASPDDDGPGDLAAATAIGVAAALATLAERLERPLAGLHVAVQGLGAVGMELCDRLASRGARLTVADLSSTRAAVVGTRCGATVVAAEAITAVPCDVFAPCALGGVLTLPVAAALPARGVCGAANNVLADADVAHVLHRRGVLVVPDFVANAGALIQGALWNLRGERVPAARIERIGATVREVFDRAAELGSPPPLVALAMARQRVERGPPGS